ncbi:hypothetical protein DFH09DRAFT_1095851 [Mycena vulgaris]|nr:hypothetical protein DFH09DRAFT_1095851 [Mycena vulgaris]
MSSIDSLQVAVSDIVSHKEAGTPVQAKYSEQNLQNNISKPSQAAGIATDNAKNNAALREILLEMFPAYLVEAQTTFPLAMNTKQPKMRPLLPKSASQSRPEPFLIKGSKIVNVRRCVAQRAHRQRELPTDIKIIKHSEPWKYSIVGPKFAKKS